jgi:hypothetical protein
MQRYTFGEWMMMVDGLIDEACSMTSRDIPDMPYRDGYDDGVSPETMARRALRSATAGWE